MWSVNIRRRALPPILFLFSCQQVCPLDVWSSPQMESLLQEPWECPTCPGLITCTELHESETPPPFILPDEKEATLPKDDANRWRHCSNRDIICQHAPSWWCPHCLPVTTVDWMVSGQKAAPSPAVWQRQWNILPKYFSWAFHWHHLSSMPSRIPLKVSFRT